MNLILFFSTCILLLGAPFIVTLLGTLGTWEVNILDVYISAASGSLCIQKDTKHKDSPWAKNAGPWH